MKKFSSDRNRRSAVGGRSENRQAGGRRGKSDDRGGDARRSNRSRSEEGNFERRNSDDAWEKRREASDESRGSRSHARDERGERPFKKQDRPYKAGTRPAGRREREEGERRPRRATDSQREEIRKDRTFDRQDEPYKAGTRPATGRYDEQRGERKDEERKRPGAEQSFDRGSGDRNRSSRYGSSNRERGSRYGEKRNYRDKENSFDRPAKKSDGKTRLNKYIANSGICSRREADDLIAAGVISVNGNIVTEMGFKVSPGDVVKFNDKAILSEKLVYVLLNKPKDYISTTDDPQHRRTVMNLIQGAGRERIYPVGRLDRATTGVLLFTNDGELTKKLTHPSHEIKKIYQVELDKNLKSSDMEILKDGIELEDGMAHVDEIFYSGDSKKTVGVELHSGKNRIVRRMFEALDYRVVKLDRVYFAGLTKKDLSRGRWRFLTEVEVANLKMLTAKKHRKSIE